MASIAVLGLLPAATATADAAAAKHSKPRMALTVKYEGGKKAKDKKARAKARAAATSFAMTPNYGPRGTKVTVKGTAFQKNYAGWVKFGGVRVANVKTDRYGRFTATFTVPSTAPIGTNTVLASVGNRQASKPFSVSSTTTTAPAPTPTATATPAPTPTATPAPTPTATPAPTPTATTATPIGTTLFSDDFTGSDGLITSASQYFGANDHPVYGMDTGVVRRVGNLAHPDPASDPRIFTQKMDFAGVRLDVRVRVNSYTYNTADYTGVKLWTRRVPNTSVDPKHPVSANNSPAIYVCQPLMSNGKTFIQKKQQGSDSYSILAQRSSGSFPIVLGQWYSIRCELTYEGTGARQRMYRDGVLISDVLDTGAVGGPPILSKGAIGIRGDGVNFDFDDLVVTSLGS